MLVEKWCSCRMIKYWQRRHHLVTHQSYFCSPVRTCQQRSVSVLSSSSQNDPHDSSSRNHNLGGNQDMPQQSYFVVIPGSTILPSNEQLQSLPISPPITFKQTQQRTTIKQPKDDNEDVDKTGNDLAGSASIRDDEKEEVFTITETEEIPIILFQSNRLLMVDKPAGWKVTVPVKDATTEENNEDAHSIDQAIKPPPGIRRLKPSKHILPYFDINVPIDENDDDDDFDINEDNDNIQRKSAVRMMAKESHDPVHKMEQIIRKIQNDAIMEENKEKYEMQLIQHLLMKKNRKKTEKQHQQQSQLLLQPSSTDHEEEDDPQKQDETLHHSDMHPDRYKQMKLSDAFAIKAGLNSSNSINQIFKIDTLYTKKEREVEQQHPKSPELVDYITNYHKRRTNGQIRYTNIVPVHGIDPVTSGLVLLATGPKCKNRFRTIYKQGIKIYYAILQPLSYYSHKLQNDVLLHARTEYNHDNPFMWKYIEGHMIAQPSRTDEIFPYDKAPTIIYTKQRDIDQLRSDPLTHNLWHCSLEYRVVPHIRSNLTNPFICIEIKTKQVGHEMIRALLSSYQLPIYGDIKYGAKIPWHIKRNNRKDNYHRDDETKSLQNQNPYYYRTAPNRNSDDNSSIVDLGLHGRIPLHCTCLQLPKHIHLGPAPGSLNVLNRTNIMAPIPYIWDEHFDWTEHDIEEWERSCIAYGIEAA